MIKIRRFSITSNKFITPFTIYSHIEDNKSLILKDNKRKSGIYRWINLVNNKSYIGSAVNLSNRFYVYFSANRLIKSKMAIYKAIIKYGYNNFKLEILEYCDKDIVLKREQYYIDNLKPEYNTLQIAGSTAGYKHTVDTLDKFKYRIASDNTKSNIAKSATGRVLDEITKEKISIARKGIKLTNETKAKLSVIATERQGVAVEVTNISSGIINKYPTLTLAGQALGVSRTAVKKALISGKLLKKVYLVKQ